MYVQIEKQCDTLFLVLDMLSGPKMLCILAQIFDLYRPEK
jgi:hypothetical protein